MKYSYKDFNNKFIEHNFDLKKKYGQNFIIDENVINSIVNKSEIDKDTLVLEIGPGAGSLTYKLAQSSKNVVCYEIDKTVKDILLENLNSLNNVEIIFEDFLKSTPKDVLKKYNYKKLYVVANLPYYITTPIITKLIEDEICVDKIVVMVQKEVGDRFKALPNTKEYNSLSVYLNYYFDIKKIMDVSRNVFLPQPKVDSIVVEFVSKKDKLHLNNKKVFFKLVRDSFVQKRKTLKNNLKNYDLDIIENVLSKYGLTLQVRAEALPLEIFVDISNHL